MRSAKLCFLNLVCILHRQEVMAAYKVAVYVM